MPDDVNRMADLLPHAAGAGVKDDGRTAPTGPKPRWDLLPIAPVAEVVDVLTYGSLKYADNNWRHVPNGVERYYAAAMRHIAAYRMGEAIDPETGRTHLSHALCCLIFLHEMEGRDGK